MGKTNNFPLFLSNEKNRLLMFEFFKKESLYCFWILFLFEMFPISIKNRNNPRQVLNDCLSNGEFVIHSFYSLQTYFHHFPIVPVSNKETFGHFFRLRDSVVISEVICTEVEHLQKSLLTVFVCLIFLAGCTSSSPNRKEAERFIREKGYTIVKYEGSGTPYVLTKELLLQMPYSMIWSLQKEPPEQHLGKTIQSEHFLVKNHPLDHAHKESIGQTDVWVLLSEGVAIGGTSFPMAKTLLMGGAYSLEGKTLEEVHGISYLQWVDEWKKRFSN